METSDLSRYRTMRIAEVKAATGLSRSAIYEKMAEQPPTFPICVALGRNTVGWYEGEITDWLRSRPRKTPSPKRLPSGGNIGGKAADTAPGHQDNTIT